MYLVRIYGVCSVLCILYAFSRLLICRELSLLHTTRICNLCIICSGNSLTFPKLSFGFFIGPIQPLRSDFLIAFSISFAIATCVSSQKYDRNCQKMLSKFELRFIIISCIEYWLLIFSKKGLFLRRSSVFFSNLTVSFREIFLFHGT